MFGIGIGMGANYEHRYKIERGLKFDYLLRANADAINAEYRESDSANFILEDSRINMDIFDDYEPKEIEEIERHNSGIDDPNIKDFRLAKMTEKGKVGETTDKDIIEFWKAERDKELSTRWEKAAVILLARRLAKDFVVIRSSLYDDYSNKTDTIIIDKESGAVICAVDLVNDKAGGERYKQKIKQLNKDAKTGGQLRFGLTVENKKLVKKSLTEVPKFFLPVDRPDLDKLLKDLPDDFEAPITDIEKNLFDKLIASLGEQAQILTQSNAGSGVKNNLSKFKKAFEKMEKIKLDRTV